MGTIKYVGTAHRRVISEADWEAAGVSKEALVYWGPENDFTVDASKLSAAARDALKADPFLVWSDKDGDTKAQVEQDVEVPLDQAKEYEDVARANTTTNGEGLEQPAESAADQPASRKRS